MSNALAIEEKYEIVVTNYLDFEKQILDTTTSYMVRENLDYSDFFDVRLGFNIRLVNLLTAVRLYADQLSQNVQNCIPSDPNAKNVVKKLFSKEYDENKEYRFMEALRNYVQHKGLPIHMIRQGGRWTDSKSDGYLEYSMELASNLSQLEQDKIFKKSVLSELDKKIDLKISVRCYLESISNVHEASRNLISESVYSARELLKEANLPAQVVQADATSLLFEDGTFDCVYSFGVLHHIPDVEKALAEIKRVLKPGGQVMAMLYNKDSLLYGYSIVYLRGIKESLLEKLTMDELLARYSERREDNPYTKAYTKLEAKDLFSGYFKDCSAEVRYNVIDLPEQRKVKVNVPDEYELGWHLIVKGVR